MSFDVTSIYQTILEKNVISFEYITTLELKYSSMLVAARFESWSKIDQAGFIHLFTSMMFYPISHKSQLMNLHLLVCLFAFICVSFSRHLKKLVFYFILGSYIWHLSASVG